MGTKINHSIYGNFLFYSLLGFVHSTSVWSSVTSNAFYQRTRTCTIFTGNNSDGESILNFHHLASNPKSILLRANFPVIFSADDVGTKELMKVELDTIRNKVCEPYFPLMASGLPDSILCSGYLEGGKDTCQVKSSLKVIHDGYLCCKVSGSWLR